MRKVVYLVIIVLIIIGCPVGYIYWYFNFKNVKILGDVSYVKWNPLGKSITYIDTEDGNSYLFEKDIKTRESKKVFNTPISEWVNFSNPTEPYDWSPDGSKIAFVSYFFPEYYKNNSKNSKIELKIFDKKTNKTETLLYIDGPTYEIFRKFGVSKTPISRIKWSKNGKYLLFKFAWGPEVLSYTSGIKNSSDNLKIADSGYYIINNKGGNLKKILDLKYNRAREVLFPLWLNDADYVYLVTSNGDEKISARYNIKTDILEDYTPPKITNNLPLCGDTLDSSPIALLGKVEGNAISPDGKTYLRVETKSFFEHVYNEYYIIRNRKFSCQPPDTDSDGVYDYLDNDKDNDGFLDEEEINQVTSILDPNEHP